MSLPLDLLEQAQFLSRRETKRPKQASLRRSVSAAYCALFHLLNATATEVIAPNVSKEVTFRIQRLFDHGEMKKVCSRYLQTPLQKPLTTLIGATTSADLRLVVLAFIQLQEARHSADYDLGSIWTRAKTQLLVDTTRDAFSAWQRIRKTSEANVFVLSLLMWKNLEYER